MQDKNVLDYFLIKEISPNIFSSLVQKADLYLLRYSKSKPK